MATTKTFSIPDGETIVDEIKKLVGSNQTFSNIVIDSLKLFKAKSIGKDYSNPSLPDWRVWMKYVQDISDNELSLFMEEAAHLASICKVQKEYRIKVTKHDS